MTTSHRTYYSTDIVTITVATITKPGSPDEIELKIDEYEAWEKSL